MIYEIVIPLLIILFITAGLLYLSHRFDKKAQEKYDEQNRIFKDLYSLLLIEARNANSIHEVNLNINRLEQKRDSLKFNDYMIILAYLEGKRNILININNQNEPNRTL